MNNGEGAADAELFGGRGAGHIVGVPVGGLLPSNTIATTVKGVRAGSFGRDGAEREIGQHREKNGQWRA